MPPVNSPGMSDRKTGTKSAWPEAIAGRSGAPTKSEFERNSFSRPGSANGAGPAVCRW